MTITLPSSKDFAEDVGEAQCVKNGSRSGRRLLLTFQGRDCERVSNRRFTKKRSCGIGERLAGPLKMMLGKA